MIWKQYNIYIYISQPLPGSFVALFTFWQPLFFKRSWNKGFKKILHFAYMDFYICLERDRIVQSLILELRQKKHSSNKGRSLNNYTYLYHCIFQHIWTQIPSPIIQFSPQNKGTPNGYQLQFRKSTFLNYRFFNFSGANYFFVLHIVKQKGSINRTCWYLSVDILSQLCS